MDSKVTSDCTIVQEVYHTAKFSKHRYVGFGYLFGRDASFGYGLRTGLRFGHLNMPNSFVTTAHLGYTYPLDQFEINKRVKHILDADIRAGTVGALPRSLAYDLKQVELIEPIFGFTLSAGTTFSEFNMMRVLHTMIRVLDLDRAIAFFNVLGFQEVKRRF